MNVEVRHYTQRDTSSAVRPRNAALRSGTIIAPLRFEGNVAEEVRDPKRNLPRAILLALGATTILYLLVTTVAVLAVPPPRLAEARTPLAAVLRHSGYESTLAIGVVSMLAGVNGALVQMIMASRIIYGMACKQMAPDFLAKVSPSTHTPPRSSVLVIRLVLVFALWLPLLALARLTSAIILIVFSLVNLALVQIKRRSTPPEPGVRTWPIGVPVVGFVLSLVFMLAQLWASITGSR